MFQKIKKSKKIVTVSQHGVGRIPALVLKMIKKTLDYGKGFRWHKKTDFQM
jgi:hypothetical protein